MSSHDSHLISYRASFFFRERIGTIEMHLVPSPVLRMLLPANLALG